MNQHARGGGTGIRTGIHMAMGHPVSTLSIASANSFRLCAWLEYYDERMYVSIWQVIFFKVFFLKCFESPRLHALQSTKDLMYLQNVSQFLMTSCVIISNQAYMRPRTFVNKNTCACYLASWSFVCIRNE